MKYHKIEITRLPDISTYRHLPEEYDDYGRFGITNSGNFYILPLVSQHDCNTRIGGYWAVNRCKKTLYLSAMGASLDFDKFVQFTIDKGFIDKILARAGLI